MLIKRFYFLVILLAPLGILAQQGLPFQQYTVEDGLPSNQIYWTAQDDKGDLWICSDHGIIAFDGISMRSFTTENGLPDNTIFKCFPDVKGRLWFTSYSKGVFWIRNDTIHIPRFNEDLLKKVGNRWLDKIYVDDHDSIWMTLYSSDTVYYKAHVDSDLTISKSIPSRNFCKDFVYFVLKDGKAVISGSSDSYLYFGENSCLDDTAIVKKGKDHEFLLKTIKNPSGFQLDEGLAETRLSRFRVYFCNGKNGFEWFSIKDKLYHLDTLGKIRLVKTYPNQILDIFLDDNKLIVSIGDNGLYVYKYLGYKLVKEDNYFKGLNVSHISKDRNGNYWISIVNQGLFKVSSFDVLALGIDLKYSGLKNISKPWLFRNDSLLFLSNQSLFIFQKEAKEFKLLEIQHIGNREKLWIPNRIIWDTKNGLYAGNLRWDFKKKELSQNHDDLGYQAKWFIKGEPSFVVYNMANGYKINQGSRTIFNSKKYNFKEKIKSILVVDSTHHYTGGLTCLYEFKNGKYFDLGEKDKRLKIRVEDIKRDKEGWVWLATRGSGLGIFKGDSLYFITKENGLSSNLLNKVFILKEQIFVSTNKGLDRIVKDSEENFNVNSILSRRRGSFALIGDVFETEGGIIVQNGNEMTFLGNTYLETPNYTPEVFLTKFSISGESQILDTNRNYSLDPNENNVSFAFRINALKNENHPTMFQFRLLGLYSNWQSSFENEILFNGLEAGEYKFEVRAKEINNQWSKASRISFSISKPFYYQLWFIFLMLFCLAGVLFYYLRFRSLQEARSKELISSNIKALKNQMNPHFIFNSLNSIQYFIVTNQKREANIFLAKLSDLVRNVLNTTNESSISLEEEINRIEDYVQLEQMRLSNSFTFRVQNHQNLGLLNFQIPPMLVQPIIENAIWHGLSDIEMEGEIVLKFELENTDLVISIIDNGHGMDIEKWEKDPSNSGKGNSIGLVNVRQRMKLLSKIKKKDYSIKFKNLISDPRKGTEVILKIPQ